MQKLLSLFDLAPPPQYSSCGRGEGKAEWGFTVCARASAVLAPPSSCRQTQSRQHGESPDKRPLPLQSPHDRDERDLLTAAHCHGAASASKHGKIVCKWRSVGQLQHLAMLDAKRVEVGACLDQYRRALPVSHAIGVHVRAHRQSGPHTASHARPSAHTARARSH
eukprot:5212739-Pleurochrysis_carterae.AAC.2